jgi:hypothetical protein
LILRTRNVAPEKTSADWICALILGLMALPIYFGLSRPLDRASRLALAIGFAPSLHPLAWFHLFVLAFPLAVLSLDRSWGHKGWFTLSAVGFACLALATRKTLGSFGEELELLSVKSWGVLLLGVALTGAARSSRTARNSKSREAVP